MVTITSVHYAAPTAPLRDGGGRLVAAEPPARTHFPLPSYLLVSSSCDLYSHTFARSTARYHYYTTHHHHTPPTPHHTTPLPTHDYCLSWTGLRFALNSYGPAARAQLPLARCPVLPVTRTAPAFFCTCTTYLPHLPFTDERTAALRYFLPAHTTLQRYYLATGYPVTYLLRWIAAVPLRACRYLRCAYAPLPPWVV